MKARILIVAQVAAIALAALLSGGCRCGTDRYGGEFRNISPQGWPYGEVLEFTPEALDTVNPGMLLLIVRHTNDYLYRNLYVEVSVDGRCDTVNVPLADDFGRWHGRGIGTDFQVTDTLYQSIRLAPGSSVAVRHVMRVDTLPDIEQVGISYITAK